MGEHICMWSIICEYFRRTTKTLLFQIALPHDIDRQEATQKLSKNLRQAICFQISPSHSQFDWWSSNCSNEYSLLVTIKWCHPLPLNGTLSTWVCIDFIVLDMTSSSFTINTRDFFSLYSVTSVHSFPYLLSVSLPHSLFEGILNITLLVHIISSLKENTCKFFNLFTQFLGIYWSFLQFD